MGISQQLIIPLFEQSKNGIQESLNVTNKELNNLDVALGGVIMQQIYSFD